MSEDVAPLSEALQNELVISNEKGLMAKITSDGILRFAVEASDENAEKFIKCLEDVFERRLTGIEVTRKPI